MSALAGTIARFSSLADGTIRYVIDVSPADDRHEFHQPHAAVALALLSGPGTNAEQSPPAIPGRHGGPSSPAASPDPNPYGSQARALRLSGFARAPKVWEALGTDESFLSWLRMQPCAAPDMMVKGGSVPTPCVGDVVAAHVRRIANGAGTGIKPPYSAVPLCARHHHDQHNGGESEIAPKEVWDAARMRYVETWAWQQLRERMRVQSMAECPPERLRAWAENVGVSHLLPREYRDE